MLEGKYDSNEPERALRDRLAQEPLQLADGVRIAIAGAGALKEALSPRTGGSRHECNVIKVSPMKPFAT